MTGEQQRPHPIKPIGYSLVRLAAIFVCASTLGIELGVELQEELLQSRIIEISK